MQQDDLKDFSDVGRSMKKTGDLKIIEYTHMWLQLNAYDPTSLFVYKKTTQHRTAMADVPIH